MPIEQNRENWSTEVRERQWVATIIGTGMPVIVSHQAVLAPGEDLTEFPPTWELTWAEWERMHESEYGLDITGARITDVTERRAAWRRIRRMANGDAPFDEATVRTAFGAVRVLLKDVMQELDD